MKLGRRKIEWYGKNNFKDLNGIDGRIKEFVGRIFPRFTTIEIMEEVKKLCKAYSVNLKNLMDESSFKSMFNEIKWRQDDTQCILNSIKDSKYARRYPCGHWSFLGPGLEKTWCKTLYWKTKLWMRRHRGINDSPTGYRISSPSFFEPPVLLKEESQIYENMVRNLLDSATMTETSNCFSAQLKICQSVYRLWILDDEDSSEAASSDDGDSSGTLQARQILEIRRLQKEDYNASRECQRLGDKFMAETKQLFSPIHPSKQRRQNPNQ